MVTAGKSGNRLEVRLLELRQRFVSSLPDRIAMIAETLRQCVGGAPESAATLDRQFHTLAGTAGTYGLFEIAAAAVDGEDECARLDGACIESGDGRYLWSVVEELQYAAAGGLVAEPTSANVFESMNHS